MTVVDRLGPEHRDRIWLGLDDWVFHWQDRPQHQLQGKWRADKRPGTGGCSGYMTFGLDQAPDGWGPFTEIPNPWVTVATSEPEPALRMVDADDLTERLNTAIQRLLPRHSNQRRLGKIEGLELALSYLRDAGG